MTTQPTTTITLPSIVDPATSPSSAEGGNSAPSRRTLANRANAAKSTGPRTTEGKARSRANAVKHGLAGEGICLPSEDAALVRERCLLLHEELGPQTMQGMMLVEAIAIAHTRMKRAARQEAAVLTYKQRGAALLYDDDRLTLAEEDLRLLAIETRTRYRHLTACPEGIDLLIERLGDVRREVRNPRIRWNYVHGQCLERFCGRDYSDPFTQSRGRALSLALEFDPSELTAEDRAAIGSDDVKQVREWAKPQMEAFIDAEVRRLLDLRATLDHAMIAQNRAEAAERAMFDAGRDAALARRYEAAATRTFLRATSELRAVEAAAEPAPTTIATTPTTPSALDSPSPGVAEVIEEGDRLTIADPADAAAAPLPERRSYERPPLASSGITAQQASDEISHPHYSRPPVPFDQPPPVYDHATGTWR